MGCRRRFISSVFVIDHTQYCPSDAIRAFIVVLISTICLWDNVLLMGAFNLVGLVICLGNLGGPTLAQQIKFLLLILASEIGTAFVAAIYWVHYDTIWYLIFPIAFLFSLIGGLLSTSLLGALINLKLAGHLPVFIGMQPKRR